MEALEASDLTFSYRRSARPALERLTLSVREGSCTGLLGPNGAGKSTFVHLVSGLLAPASGALTIFGHRSGSRPAQRAIGFCPQELALHPTLTAVENLRLFGRLSGLRSARLAERVEACLETAGLTREAGERVERFSGGMKRRLNLAIALLHEPRLLLLDEPTAGVDAQSRLAIFATLERQSRAGTTIVYTTHYLEEVERLCQDVVVIDHGRTIAAGTTSELMSRCRRTQTFRLTLRAGRDATELATDLGYGGLRARALSSLEVELGGAQPGELLAEVLRLVECGDVVSYETSRPSLEETFLELTGEALRD